MTRPLDAPRSMAANDPRGSPQEGGGDARVDWDVQSGGLAEVAAGQREDRRGDVLGQDFALEQRPLGVELAESFSSTP